MKKEDIYCNWEMEEFKKEYPISYAVSTVIAWAIVIVLGALFVYGVVTKTF